MDIEFVIKRFKILIIIKYKSDMKSTLTCKLYEIDNN